MARIARSLTAGSVFRIGAQALAGLLSFFLTPFFVHHLGDAAYGVWSTAGGFGKYWGLLDIGFQATFLRSLARAFTFRDHLLSIRLFKLSVRIALFVGAAALLSALCLRAIGATLFKSVGESELFKTVVVLCALNSGVVYLYRTFTTALNADLRYANSALLDIGMTTCRAAFMVSAVLAGFGVVGMAWAAVLGVVLPLVLALICVCRLIPFKGVTQTLPGLDLRALTSYSLISFAAKTGDVFRYNLDVPLAAMLFGAAAVTHYTVALKATAYASLLLHAALDVFMPLFSRLQADQDFAQLRRTYLFATKSACVCSVFVCVLLIRFGSKFVSLWIGPRYLDTVPCLLWLTFAMVVGVLQIPTTSLLFGTAHHGSYAILAWAEGFLTLASCIILGRHFGMVGIAMAKCLPACLIRFIVQPLFACSVAEIRWRTYWSTVMRAITLSSAFAALSLSVSRSISPTGYVSIFATIAASTAVFAALSLAFTFTSAERQLFRIVLNGQRDMAHV
jgi:O-antigen/teichoic acid export membrane protein